MPMLALPPQSVPLVRRLNETAFPALDSAQGKAGRLLAGMVERARSRWYGHSASLTERAEQIDALDSAAAFVRFPVVRSVEVTFHCIGRLKPIPVPDLDD